MEIPKEKEIIKQEDMCYSSRDIYEPRTRKGWILHDEYIKEIERRYNQ